MIKHGIVESNTKPDAIIQSGLLKKSLNLKLTVKRSTNTN